MGEKHDVGLRHDRLPRRHRRPAVGRAVQRPRHGDDAASSVAVSPAGGTVYVTGQSFGTSARARTTPRSPTTATGTQRWVRRYTFPGGNTDDATSVAVSPAGGTVYVTGHSWGGASGYDYATVAYAAAGTQQWVRRYNGTGNTTTGPAR